MKKLNQKEREVLKRERKGKTHFSEPSITIFKWDSSDFSILKEKKEKIEKKNKSPKHKTKKTRHLKNTLFFDAVFCKKRKFPCFPPKPSFAAKLLKIKTFSQHFSSFLRLFGKENEKKKIGSNNALICGFQTK